MNGGPILRAEPTASTHRGISPGTLSQLNLDYGENGPDSDNTSPIGGMVSKSLIGQLCGNSQQCGVREGGDLHALDLNNVETIMHKLLVGAAALAILAVGTQAFAADNATATATANIVTPISVTSDQNLIFGNLLAGTGGTVVVSPLDARTKTGGITLLTGVAPKAAHFAIVADTNGGATYVVSYTKTDLTGAGPDLVISAITSDTAPTSGNASTKVGATITVASAQAPGTYTGSLTATAVYN
ncbi:MAG: hypothetical protein JWO33_431 [Caulobacteraceae bacterium]|nr:hypothetical protein [Caulobacteraceae bacterium]